jgi:hypothetical protein
VNFKILIVPSRASFMSITIPGYEDLLDRLRGDPGLRTLGQLIQEREAAFIEIARLRREVERLTNPPRSRGRPVDSLPSMIDSTTLLVASVLQSSS